MIALTLHELAHGYVALRCGDPTAQMMGRLSFNPLRHLDPIGTLFMLLFGFGWARPVPVNSRNFKNFRRDDLLVSIAGVVTNFCLFFLSMLIMVLTTTLLFTPDLWQVGELTTYRDFLRFDGWNFYSILSGSNLLYVKEAGEYVYYQDSITSFLRTPWLLYVQRFLMFFAQLNLGLAVFNLLPIPPLDGYHVFNDILLRGRLHIPANVMRIVMIGMLFAFYFTNFFSTLIGKVMYFVQGGVVDLLLAVFGLR
nr:membrane metalloprotease [uncultured bacterium]